MYVASDHGMQTKVEVAKIVDDLRDAFRQIIQETEWMDDGRSYVGGFNTFHEIEISYAYFSTIMQQLSVVF